MSLIDSKAGCHGVLEIPGYGALNPGYGSVNYLELNGSPHEHFNRNELSVVRDFVVHWEDRYAFLIGMLGDAARKKLIDQPGYGVNRIIPHVYEGHVRFGQKGKPLYATQVLGSEPWSPSDQDPGNAVFDYNYVKFQIKYEVFKFPVLTDSEAADVIGKLEQTPPTKKFADLTVDEGWNVRFITRFIQPGPEAGILRSGVMKWVAGPLQGKKVIGARTYLEPALQVQYVWRQAPGRPDPTKVPIGKLNENYWDRIVDENGDARPLFPPKTLLLEGMSLRPYRLASGRRVADINYKMKYFEPAEGKTHNHFLQYAIGQKNYTYEEMSTTGKAGDPTVYKVGDFTQLFNPEHLIDPSEA